MSLEIKRLHLASLGQPGDAQGETPVYFAGTGSGRVRLCSVTTGGGGSSSDGFSSLAAGFGLGDSEGDGLGFCPRSIVPLINKISKAAGSRKEIWSIVVPLPFSRN